MIFSSSVVSGDDQDRLSPSESHPTHERTGVRERGTVSAPNWGWERRLVTRNANGAQTLRNKDEQTVFHSPAVGRSQEG